MKRENEFPLDTGSEVQGLGIIKTMEQEAVAACLQMMVQENRVQHAGCDEICQNLLEIILLRLRREDFSLSSTPSGPCSGRNCDMVRRYIDNHFKENLTLD